MGGNPLTNMRNRIFELTLITATAVGIHRQFDNWFTFALMIIMISFTGYWVINKLFDRQ